MSSRFDNLIQSVFNKFEYDEYTLLLAEALSVAKIQDELKAKGVDIDAYNSKHHLFILALINSNLNLDVYNQLITTIKDQGILNRLMSQTVDRRSDKPTVDFEIINKVLQNANNIPEINSILNSISQTREKKTDTGPKEYAAGQSPSERNLAAASKLFKEWLYNNGLGEANEHEVAAILEKYKAIIDPFKEKYPDDRLLQNNSYLLALVYCLTKTKGDILSKTDNIKKVMDLYFAHPELMEQNVIFNSPYRDNFYKLSNYVYKYNAESSLRKNKSDSEESALIYSDENVEVFLGTVESHEESIRRCIKYGQGPKYNLCISTTSDNYYSKYRVDPNYQGGKINLTTHFVYFKTPELINQYGAKSTVPFFIIDTYTTEHDNEGDIKYQINRASPNAEFDATKSSILDEYPILQKAFDDEVFKVKYTTQSEKDYYFNKKKSKNQVNSPEALIDLAKHNPDQLNDQHILEDFYEKYPETFDYAFELYLKSRDDRFNDHLNIYNAQYYETYFALNSIQNFIKDKPEYKSMVDEYLVDKDFKNLLATKIKLASNLSFDEISDIGEQYPDKVSQFIKRYINSKEDRMDYFIKKLNPQDDEDEDYYDDGSDRTDIIYDILTFDKKYLSGVKNFLDNYKKYNTKEVQKQLEDVKQKEINAIKNLDYYTDSVVKLLRDFDYKEEEIVDMVKFYLDKNISHEIEYLKNNPNFVDFSRNIEREYFNPLKNTLKKYPEIKERYKDLRIKYKIGLFNSLIKNERILQDTDYLIDEQDETNAEAVKIGLPLYLEDKIKQITKTPLVKSLYGVYPETQGYAHYVNDYLDMVFRFLDGKFYQKYKDIIDQYDEVRIKHKYNLINALNVTDVLDGKFFERTYESFPEETQKIYNYYIEFKLNSLNIAFDAFERLSTKSEFYEKISKGNISKFILNPIRYFNQQYPNFLENYIKTHGSEKRFNRISKYLVIYFTMFNSTLGYNDLDEVNELLNNDRNFKNNKFKFFNDIVKEVEKKVNSKTDYHLITVYEKIYSLLTGFYGFINEQDKKTFDQIIEANKEKISIIISKYILSNLTKSYDYDEIFFRNRKAPAGRAEELSLLTYFYDPPDKTNDIGYIINKLSNGFDIFSYINDNIEPDQKIDVRHFTQKLFPHIRLIYKNEKYKKIFYEILKKVNFSDNINQISKHDLGLYLTLLSEYEDVTDSVIYKSVKKYDEEMIEYYFNQLKIQQEVEIDGETFYVVSKNTTYLPTTSYFNPDLSKYIFLGKLDISLSYTTVDNLKWLPRQVGYGSTLAIYSAAVKNIDHIPDGVLNLTLTNVDLQEGSSIAPNSITNIQLTSVTNLKDLKIFNQQKKGLSSLWLINLPDLISLEGANMVSGAYMLLKNLKNIKNFEGIKAKLLGKIDIVDMEIHNFIGIPKANYYMIGSIVYSFKGLPSSIKTLQINKHDQLQSNEMNKQFPVREYKSFPKYVENLEINNNTLAKILFGKLKSTFPALGGTSKINWMRFGGKPFADAYKKYVDRIRKNKDKVRSTKKRVKAVQAKRAKPLSREEEIENIERQQDKAANKEKIKRLSKEDLELVTPFNVLLEDIVNTIKTSFKVYK